MTAEEFRQAVMVDLSVFKGLFMVLTFTIGWLCGEI